MAATGKEVPLLSQLLRLKNNLVSLINQRLVAPTESGTDGQILVWQMPGSANNETIWVDPVDAISSASQSSSGLMTAADKKKLDGMSSHLFNVPVVLRGNTTMSGLNFTLTMTLADNIEDGVTLHQGDTVFVADASQDTFEMASTGGVYVLLAPEMVINPYSGEAASALFAPVYDPSMSI